MHFTIDQQDSTTIFRLKGSPDAPARLDSANAGNLKAEFLILAQPDVETLIVDLSEVTYVDSAGLSSLLLAERQQSAHGGDVRLVGANQTVQSLLRLTQLDRVFAMYATLDDAMNAEDTFNSTGADGSGESSKASPSGKGAALAVGGSLGAAALAAIMMDTSGDDEFDDDFDDDDDLDDDDDDDDFEDDDLDEAPAKAKPGSLDEEEDEADRKALNEQDDDSEEEEDLDPDELDDDEIAEDLDEDLDPEDFDDLDDDDDDDFEEDDIL